VSSHWHCEGSEQTLKEQQSRQVHVGMGQHHFHVFDVHDEDMRIGGPDVVLDHKPAASPRGSRPQSGMVEFELPRPVDA
jgi:hypothetical protein